MLSFPNAKINIGLNVLSKREDGYHNIESFLYPVMWRDVLEIIESDHFEFKQTGLPIDGDGSDNLCFKAYEILQDDFGIGPVKMHLHKVIPMGAGLGGGSSDGAFTLKMLNAIFNMDLGSSDLKNYASKLGSDCPFFIDNIPAIATGTGTELEPFQLDLKGYYLAIINPGIHVGTREAYNGIKPGFPDQSLKQSLDQNPSTWKMNVKNDFESTIFPTYGEIKEIKEMLIKKGAIYSAMSGSGSSVYGIFENEPDLHENPKYDFHLSFL